MFLECRNVVKAIPSLWQYYLYNPISQAVWNLPLLFSSTCCVTTDSSIENAIFEASQKDVGNWTIWENYEEFVKKSDKTIGNS